MSKYTGIFKINKKSLEKSLIFDAIKIKMVEANMKIAC